VSMLAAIFQYGLMHTIAVPSSSSFPLYTDVHAVFPADALESRQTMYAQLQFLPVCSSLLILNKAFATILLKKFWMSCGHSKSLRHSLAATECLSPQKRPDTASTHKFGELLEGPLLERKASCPSMRTKAASFVSDLLGNCVETAQHRSGTKTPVTS